MLAERVEVHLVGAPDHHAVELHVLLLQSDLARLDGELQVLERVERALQQIAELEQAARGLDELAVRLEQRGRLERSGQRGERSIGRDLPLAGVDGHLRADGDGADAVALRDEVALDLHVPQHLGERAVVARRAAPRRPAGSCARAGRA